MIKGNLAKKIKKVREEYRIGIVRKVGEDICEGGGGHKN